MKKLITSALCTAMAFTANAEDYFDLSLEELMNIEITTASKQEESAFESAAATHVITNEDVRKSGATSIAEVLRLAPGVQVSRIDSDEWAVAIRGFNDRFSDKLLVLVDGRSAYVPLFSGVYWNTLDYLLNDIERIEIIRGPGGAVWGANAVHGVINIITKRAKDTQGTYLSVAAGDLEKNITEARRGAKLADNAYYSAFARTVSRGEMRDATDHTEADDSWQMNRAGFKYEVDNEASERLSIQSEAYDGDTQQIYNALPISGGSNSKISTTEVYGGNINAKYRKKYSDDSKFDAQFYVDYDNRDEIILDRSNRTLNVDLQHYYRYSDTNELLYGAEYRNIHDNLREQAIDGITYIQFERDKLTYNVYSAFFQNKTELAADKLFFTVGSKFEYNDFTHDNYQPTARLSYFPDSNNHLWAAVSKAVRTPTRWEDGMTRISSISGTSYTVLKGNEQYHDESTISYEVGYKSQPIERLSFDLTGYFNEYKHLRNLVVTSGCDVAGSGGSNDDVCINIDNSGHGEAYGAELSANLDLTKKLRLSAAYTFNRTIIEAGGDNVYENRIPRNQLNLKAYYNVSERLQFDNIMYYSDNLSDVSTGIDANAYIRWDSKLTYDLDDKAKLSLIGQNLTDPQHQEWGASLYSSTREIGRTVLVKLSYSF